MKFVFVIGAGASAEFGLPVGNALARSVSERTQYRNNEHSSSPHDKELNLAFQQFKSRNPSQYSDLNLRTESIRLSNGLALAPSIDNYLYSHRENEARVFLGKAAIVRELLQAERDSKLYFDYSKSGAGIDFWNIHETWLATLFRILMTFGDKHSLTTSLKNITFACFNYDRVIERFFFLAMQVYFDMSETESSVYCEENLDIYHPYGRIGELRLTNNSSGFGEQLDHDLLVGAVSGLNTFGEASNRHIQALIRQKIFDADVLFFLGFSFLRINMDYLQPNTKSSFVRIICTSKGLSEDNLRFAHERLELDFVNQNLEANLSFEHSFCEKLISNYSSFIADSLARH